MTLFIRSLHFGGLLADQVAVDADAVDDEQSDILPADAFAVGLEKPPGDQRDAAGDEDHERPAGPAPPQVQRDDQRRQRRRASAIILQRVEKRIAHDKAPIKANSPAALNAGQAMWRPFVYTALNTPVASQAAPMTASSPFGVPGQVTVAAEMSINTAVACRSEEHTSELQSLMRISYAVFCLQKKSNKTN